MIATAIILIAGLLDFLFENVSILYLLPALYVARYVRGRTELLCYALLPVIVFLAPWLAGTDRLSERGILNRSMGLVTGMCMAYVIRERQRSHQLAISKRQLQERLQEFTVLNDVGFICSQGSDIEEILTKTTRRIADTLFPNHCGFLLLDEERRVLVPHPSFVHSGPHAHDTEIPLDTGLTSQTANSGCLHFFMGGKLAGVLNVESSQDQAFTEADERILKAVLDLVGSACERLRIQNELQRSREQFERLFNASPLPELIFGLADGKILNANQQFQEVFACQQNEVIGKTGTELVLWCDLAQRDAMISAIRHQKTVRDFEARLRSQTGQEFDMLISAQVIELEELQAVILQANDLTRRKQAERELLRSTSLLQAVAEGTNDAVFVKDRQGRYLLFNEAASRFVGKPVSEVLGFDDTSLFDPESARWLLEHDRHIMESGQIETQEETLTSSGMTRTYLSTKAPYRNEQGEVIGLIGISRDISERIKLEQALRESEERHRKLFETCADAIFLMDTHGQIRSTNPAAAQMHGYSVQELLTMNIRDLDAETDALLVHERMARLRAGETLSFEVTHRRRDGSEFPMDVVASTLKIGDELFVLAFDRDKTAQKHLEEQLRQSQKMDAIGQLAGGIAHDFNNLLTVINGYSDLLVERLSEQDDSRPLVLQIAEAGRRAAQVTNQLLAFSRRAYVEPRVLDLNLIVSRSEQLLRRLIGEHITLSVKLAAESGYVYADEGQIDQVLMNLIVNARDAMPKGGRIVVVSSTATDRDIQRIARQRVGTGSYVQLSITDTGFGMTPDVCQRIFEPFFTTKATGKGTGLGLSVVHGIIRQSGGHIHVLSEPEVGTTFLMWLPQVSAPPSSQDIRVDPSPVARKGRILLVEDEAGVRHLIRDSLLTQGHEVHEACDAGSAMRFLIAPEASHDLLITDMVMPGMTGTQLAAVAIERQPALPVLYISGYADHEPLRFNLKRPPEFSGREVFLQKPFSPSQLITTVHQILQSTVQKTP